MGPGHVIVPRYRDGVAESSQAHPDLDRLIERVGRRRSHRQAHVLGQLGRLCLSAAERQDLEARRHALPSIGTRRRWIEGRSGLAPTRGPRRRARRRPPGAAARRPSGRTRRAAAASSRTSRRRTPARSSSTSRWASVRGRDRPERLPELVEARAALVRRVEDRDGVAPLEDVRRAADLLGNRPCSLTPRHSDCTGVSSSARSSTSSIVITGWNVISSRTSSGTSSRSARLRSGRITSVRPGGVRGEHLLLEPADRQHAALQRDLAGHADRVLHRAPGEERRERRRHRDAGARPVLRDRARRDVHVERAVLERVLVDAELGGVRAHVGERDPRRLLHHVAELAGEHEPCRRPWRRRLDEEHVAAGRRSPRGRSRRRGPPCAPPTSWKNFWRPSASRTASVVDRDRRLDLAGGDPRRGLAQQRAELALELAHARLARVLGDDELERRRRRSRPRPRAGRCARAGAATGSRARSRPSRRSCSRRSG